MRLIIVGCEYSGVTTLINELYDWGNERGVHHPLDEHFTILDAYHLSQEEQNGMLDVLPGIKERFQRFHENVVVGNTFLRSREGGEGGAKLRAYNS